MQFIDLHAQQSIIRDKIKEKINRVLDHGKYILGPEVEELERKICDCLEVEYAVGVASGTDALQMGLMACGVGPGDAVFTSTFTFIATAEVIRLLGATPIFVDIQADTFNIDPVKLEKEINRVSSEGNLKPKVVIPVDLFGQPADYDEINNLAEKQEMIVFEDAAQSFGASYREKKTGSLAHLAATSFFPAKPLGCYGDGGMVFTNSEELCQKLISIRVHGKGTNKYENVRIGVNGRLDTLQAAILLAKLEIFENELELRQQVAERYNRGLNKIVTVPCIKDYNISAWAQYSVIHPQREKMIARLREEGIPTAIYYPKPLHLQEVFFDLGYQSGDFPISEGVAEQIFSLPMHPYLDEADQNKIIEIIERHSSEL